MNQYDKETVYEKDEMFKKMRVAFNGTNYIKFLSGLTPLEQFFSLAPCRVWNGYDIKMVTLSVGHEGPINHLVSKPFTILSGFKDESEVVEAACSVRDHLESNLLSLSKLPNGWNIPLSRDILILEKLPNLIYGECETVLRPGDEIYTQCSNLNIKFYHSGVYAGEGMMYHFVSEPGTSVGDSVQTFGKIAGKVCYESFRSYLYALSEDDSYGNPPPVFRVHHPLKTKAPKTILECCEAMRDSCKFSAYDIMENNCQHFSSTCVYDRAFSYDMENKIKKFACVLMRPTCSLLFRSIKHLSSPKRSDV